MPNTANARGEGSNGGSRETEVDQAAQTIGEAHMTKREEILRELLKLTPPAQEVIARARECDTEYDRGSVIRVEPGDVRHILIRYLDGDITSEDVLDWSNIIETHPQFIYQPEYEGRLRPIIHDLANPTLIQRELSPEFARELLRLMN